MKLENAVLSDNRYLPILTFLIFFDDNSTIIWDTA